jgi:tetratricopeptide (TPR) repeat protein
MSEFARPFALDALLSELRAAEALVRAEAARVLPWSSMLAIERHADLAAAAWLAGEGWGAAPAVAEPEPEAFDAEPIEPDLVETLAPVAAVAAVAAAAAPLQAMSQRFVEEDTLDEETVIEEDFDLDDTGPASFSDDPTQEEPASVVLPLELPAIEDEPTFVVEDPTPYVTNVAPAQSAPSYVIEDEPSYVIESDEEEDLLVEVDEPEPPRAAYDPNLSYVSFEEPEVEAEAEPAPLPAALRPAPPAHTDSYVRFDDDGAVDDDDATAGNLQRPVAPPPLEVEELDIDEPSFSDVGQDALVTMDDRDTMLHDALSQPSDVIEDGMESFDLMPDISDEEPVLADEEVTLVHGLDELAPSSDLEESSDDPSSSEVLMNRASPKPAPRTSGSTPAAAAARGASAQPAAPRVAPPPRVAPAAAAPRVAPAAAAASPRVTSGLYGNSAVPTIREGNEPAPKAAAVQLNSGGAGGRMVGLEEEIEPIPIASAEDYGEVIDYSNAGLSIELQEYEEEEVEEPEPAPAPPPKVYEEPVGPSPAEIKQMYATAQKAAELGQLQEAADLFSDVIDADENHLDAHVARGRLYLDLGDYARAMSDFMVAEEIDEASPEPQVAIGDLYFHRKDYRKAIDYFNAALQMSPNHAMAFCRRGISHYYRKNYKEALDDLERANKLDPDIPNISSFISMAKRKSVPTKR